MSRLGGAMLTILLVAMGLAAYAAAGPPAATTQQECERASGVWRDGACTRASSGY